MAKEKVSYSCNNCGHRPPKWVGCCPNCNEWDTVEEIQPIQPSLKSFEKAPLAKLTTLDNVHTTQQQRMLSSVNEWDRVVGGGLVPGSFIILTGDPGIGKSTLLLQIAHSLAETYSIMYVSSEESLEQVKGRAQRLNCTTYSIQFSDQAQIETILSTAEHYKPDILIIDSIQNCYSTHKQISPGSISQLREAAFALMRLAKEQNITVILTGHITKEGTIAGPKLLEHMVDGVFYLQGEDRWQTRMLRSVKNRFGPLHEIGFFSMHHDGLQEMPNINEQLLHDVSYSPGSTLVSYIEGSKPLLLELQALTVQSKFGIPQRIVSGLDPKQVGLIAAILEKYLQIQLNNQDIFFKVSGGFKIKESSVDLGIALALLSSYFQKPLPRQTIALGEISLTGQIKPINQLSIHLQEATKFGIKQVLIASQQKIDDSRCTGTRFKNVYDLLRLFEDS